MRPLQPIPTLSLACLLACGPLAPPDEVSSTTTTDAPSSTTTAPTTPAPTTFTAPTTIDTSTTSPGDDSGTDSTIECDVLEQDCGPKQKCVPWAEGGGSAWNASKCVDITGDGAPGDPCTAAEGGVAGIDDCAFGAVCWDVDADLRGTCVAQCTGTWEALLCPPEFTCAIASNGVLALCVSTCDPLLQDCPDDELCLPIGDAFICIFDASGDEGQTNDPCEFADACDKGLVCLNTAAASAVCQQNASGCCQPFCAFPNSPCPNPDQQCSQWFDPKLPIPKGHETVGVCAIPE